MLLLISTTLACWGAAGLLEYLFPMLPFGLQNPRFPAGTQLLHFIAILATGLVFLVGYYRRCTWTPYATITLYAVLATLCFVETVDFGAFGGGSTRFIPMAVEYALYIALSTYLLKSPVMHRRFAGRPSSDGESYRA